MKENLDSVYKTYVHDIYRFLLSLSHDHHTAEDLVQETFFRAYLYLEHYTGESVKAWLFKVAYHAYVDHYRKHRRTIVKEQSFFNSFIDKKKGTEERIVIKEDFAELIAMLRDLPEKHRSAVLLRDFHGLSYTEAAQVMDVSLSYFKVLLFRARQTLRQRGTEER